MNFAKTRRTMTLMCGVVTLTTAPMLSPATTAFAYTNQIDGCNQTCETDCTSKGTSCRQASGSPSKCVLSSNITCTSGDGPIEIASGHDLDLSGHTITCSETDPANCAYAAILLGASGSKVTDTAGGSVISGRFRWGVNCSSKTSSIVEKLTINDSIYAIADCQTVRNNVIGPTSQYTIYATNYGIFTSGISNTDSITENYIESRVLPIISTSTYALDVQKNVIKGTGLSAIWLAYGQTDSYGTAKFNIIFGDFTSSGTVFSSPSGTHDHVSYDGNFCDPDLAGSGCTNCISSGRCMPYAAPFTGNS